MSKQVMEMALEALQEWMATAVALSASDNSCDPPIELEKSDFALIAALQEAIKTHGEPVAWRYRDANGVYRYRGYVPDFDKTHAILKPIPLYSSATTIPEGWQLVPKEPTHEMVNIATGTCAPPDAIYKAMLSAAPKGADQ